MTGDWWLVTWGTYGSWLPGDPRGFKTWRKREYVPPVYGKAQPGEATYDPQNYAERHQAAKNICPDGVSLNADAQAACMTGIVGDIAQIEIAPRILAVAAQHVHLIAKFGDLLIRPTVGRMKFAATQAIHNAGCLSGRIWSKGCHMESLTEKDAFEQAYLYVADHETAAAHVHRWNID